MYKILSIKFPLILFLVLYSGSSITHENINHNIDASSDKQIDRRFTLLVWQSLPKRAVPDRRDQVARSRANG